MGKSRYKIIESGKTYFITSSVINWLSLFALLALAGIVIKANRPEFLLEQLKFYKKHNNDQIYQVWQEGLHPKLILDDKMLTGTIEYIYYNPVKERTFNGLITRHGCGHSGIEKEIRKI